MPGPPDFFIVPSPSTEKWGDALLPPDGHTGGFV